MRALFAELMGRATGVCGGRGGSQHLHWRNFYSNGVQGGIVPVATGMALAEKALQRGTVTLAFHRRWHIGRGRGLRVAEPGLAVVSTHPVRGREQSHRPDHTRSSWRWRAPSTGRFEAFGIPVRELDSSDVLEIHAAAGELIAAVRSERRPRALLLHTCRFGPHSKGDDTRSVQEVERMRKERDPLRIHAARLPARERQELSGRWMRRSRRLSSRRWATHSLLFNNRRRVRQNAPAINRRAMHDAPWKGALNVEYIISM